MLVEEDSASSTDAIDFGIFSEVRLIPEFSISMDPGRSSSQLCGIFLWNSRYDYAIHVKMIESVYLVGHASASSPSASAEASVSALCSPSQEKRQYYSLASSTRRSIPSVEAFSMAPPFKPPSVRQSLNVNNLMEQLLFPRYQL
jgi:hypothetical protein